MPGFLLLVYLCSQASKTVTHVIIYYKKFIEYREKLKILYTKQLNIKKLISRSENTQLLAK